LASKGNARALAKLQALKSQTLLLGWPRYSVKHGDLRMQRIVTTNTRNKTSPLWLLKMQLLPDPAQHPQLKDIIHGVYSHVGLKYY